MRKEYYEYWPNFNPQYYILDKPIRQVTVDSGNNIFSDTRFDYDNISSGTNVDIRSIGTPIKQGELTLVQKVIDSNNDTSDVTYGYDKYGNQTSACAYKNDGTAGLAPTSDCDFNDYEI